MKRLPGSFQIAGQTITVQQVDDLFDRDGVHGDWCAKSNTIRIQAPNSDHPDEVVFATLYHETVHAVLDLSGHDELSRDESFVERIAQLLYQAEKTRRPQRS